MEFKEGTSIYTSDGKEAGRIERFVIDPHTQEIIALVARQGILFTEDKVIPVDAVASASEKQVILTAAGNPDELPEFEETYYVSPDEADYRNDMTPAYYAPLYYYPPVGVAPLVPLTPVGRQATYQNIPAGTVAVSTGAAVMSHDGHHAGDVKRVITDAHTDKVTHIVISQGLLFKEEKTVPITWVTDVDEDEIHLAVNASVLDKIHTNNPA